MIEVLRLGHRIARDKRISTHVALTARAFSGKKIYYSGQKDSEMEKSVNNITKKFGGKFKIEYVKDEIKLIKEKKFKVVHLTIYGLPIQKEIKNIRKNKNILVVVGGEKVPKEIYRIADYNIAITNQPHSEVSSLCYFIDYYFERKELLKKFYDPKLKIIGKKKGKEVIKS